MRLLPSRYQLPTGPRRADVLDKARLGRTFPLRAVEAIFEALEAVSLGERLTRRTRARAISFDRAHWDVEAELLWRFRAASILDAYILGWFVVEVMLLLCAPSLTPWALGLLAGYRLVEIVQVLGNGLLFDRRRAMARGVGTYNVLALNRSLVHSIVLFAETTLCFAILEFVARDSIRGMSHPSDALDFSLRTITTIGPALTADGRARFLVDLEPAFGFLFGALVLSRVVGVLPRHGDVDEHLGATYAEGREVDSP